MRMRYFSIPAVFLATTFAVTACGSPNGTGPASGDAPAQTTSSSSGASSSSSPVASGSGSGQAAFAAALAQWKKAAQEPLATMNTYLARAASDLRAANDPRYATAISQLTYLANLPNSNDTARQQATGEKDHKALNSFFGTPGLS